MAAGAPTGGSHSPSTWGQDWRDVRNLRHASSPAGGVGLLRVAGADPGRPGLLRFGLMGEYFTSADFPVQDAEHRRTAGTFSLAYVPLDFLELSVAYTASSNTSSRSSPNLIQALGDVSAGARATHQWVPGLWAGVELRVMTFSGVGDASLDRYAFGFAPRLLGTYDLLPGTGLPLRAHANAGLLLDGSEDLTDGEPLNASEEYALGINRYHRLSVGVGVEAPLPGVTPFLEYGLAYPLGVEGPLAAPDGTTLSAGSAAPQVLGLGVRVTAVRDLTLTVAAELAMHRRVALGVASTPPLNFFLGASYTVDVLGSKPSPVQERAPVVERPVEAPAPKQARVEGVVVDARTGQPLPGVLIAVVGARLPPVATDPGTGRFLTYELEGGPVKLSIRKDGYVPTERELVLQPGEQATLEVSLQAEVRPARLAFAVTSRKRPVGATLTLQGAGGPRRLEVPGAGAAKLEVPAGRYGVDITAPGHLAQTRVVQVDEGAGLEVAFELKPEPRRKQVSVKEDRLELEQPLRFADGSAVLLPESLPLLAQVVDALVRHGVRKVRVEGHTDNQGDKEANLRLSRERARAVADQLIRAGLDASRLEVEGYGGTRPVAPNLTPRGRELNRRVDFVILAR